MKPQMGVVLFECKPSGKAYLACAKDTRGAINSKCFQLENGSCFHKKLQAEWRQHGPEAFDVRVLEQLDYDKDEVKTDYTEDLRALRDICRERFSECEYI